MNGTENASGKPRTIDTLEKMVHNASYGASKHPRTFFTQNTNPCDNIKLRMVIGGWTDYYVNHSDTWVAFNIHGKRVNVYNDKLDDNTITFQWDFNTLRTTVEGLVKAMSLIDKWLEV